MNYLLVYLNCLTATNNMTLAYSPANPPQAPRKNVKPSEHIRHVPSGRTMPTTPQKPERKGVVRILLHEFNITKNSKKKVLFPLVV